MQTYRYKICTYPSGKKRCYVWRSQQIRPGKVLGHWATIGLDSPEHMRSLGYTVEVEYVTKNPGDKFK